MRTATADRAGALGSTEPGPGRPVPLLDVRVPALSFVAFRVAFGSIVALGSVRFIARGWVGEFYVEPDRHLTYARFEWVRPLPGPWMYALMALLALAGVAIATGRRLRIAAAFFAVGFAYTELIDAALYLNHYWFVTLAAVLLAVLPGPAGDGTIPAYAVWAIRGQLACVYLFAGLAKLNPDWLFDAQPLRIWLDARTDRPVVGPWLDEPLAAYLFSWAGAAFDLTIVGWLLWRRSRPVAYAAVVTFHVATAALFQIGVFPWVMIACTPIFFTPDWPRRLRDRLRPLAEQPHDRPDTAPRVRPRSRWRMITLAALAAGNVALPLRHLAADGNVRFNDDGYYLSWRVMLTERAAFVEYQVIDPHTGDTRLVRAGDLLEPWQVAQADTRPDLILATAHLIADETERDIGLRPIVHVDAWVSVNGRPRQRWIDPTVDLATLPRSSRAATYVLPFEPPVRS
jgi:vitamin K-dependent gamma-carboxylase